MTGEENPLPYAPIPHDMLRDLGKEKLHAIDVVIAGLILGFLGKKSSGFVLNRILARRAGLTVRGVQLSLDRLQERHWYRHGPDPSLKLGRRRITALWRTGERKALVAAGVNGDSPPGVNDGSPLRVNGDSSKKEGESKKEYQEGTSSACGTGRPEITLLSSATDSAGGLADGDSEAPQTIEDDPAAVAKRVALRRLVEGLAVRQRDGRKHAGAVAKAAHLLADLLMDPGSRGFYRKVCYRITRGEVRPDEVIRALDATYDQVAGREIGVMGAYFNGALKNILADRAYTDEVEPEWRARQIADSQDARNRAG